MKVRVWGKIGGRGEPIHAARGCDAESRVVRARDARQILAPEEARRAPGPPRPAGSVCSVCICSVCILLPSGLLWGCQALSTSLPVVSFSGCAVSWLKLGSSGGGSPAGAPASTTSTSTSPSRLFSFPRTVVAAVAVSAVSATVDQLRHLHSASRGGKRSIRRGCRGTRLAASGCHLR